MKLHDEFIWNDIWEGNEVAFDGTFRYIIAPMLFNHRLMVVRDGSPEAAHGWCFKSAPHAVLAAGTWEPNTEDEPLFWHKRAGEPRRAPQRDHNPNYNQPRCVHGSYLHNGSCETDPFCAEFQRQGSP